MKIKYQIFVSSTYEDLEEERDLVIKAILEMGHIPVGMEMFSAGDEEQWKLIQKQIDDCDYYVVITAHRYGSEDGHVGYTEKEYDYAVSKGIPALGFVIHESAEWPIGKSDTDTDKKKKLDFFKAKIKKKLISHWNNKEDLYGKVSIALMKQFTVNPGVGWIKANELVGTDVLLSELTRLSKENSDFREQLKIANELAVNNDTEKNDELINTLKKRKANLWTFYSDSDDWEDERQVALYEIFDVIVPELMVENSTLKLANIIAFTLRSDKDRQVRRNWPTPENITRKILADFGILELIKPSLKKRSLKDTGDYWTLTQEGKNLFKAIRRRSFELEDFRDSLIAKSEAEDTDTDDIF